MTAVKPTRKLRKLESLIVFSRIARPISLVKMPVHEDDVKQVVARSDACA